MKILEFGIILLLALVTSCYSKSCSDFVFSNNAVYTVCNDLPVLNSTLHWNYHQPNHTVDIAYRHGGVTAANWVAWALNLDGQGMVGAQSLVAFRNSSGDIRAYTTVISGYRTQLQPGPLSFRVPKISAEFSGGEMVIFATLELPAGRTRFNQVWQDGPVSGSTLRVHAMTGDNLQSTGSMDFASGKTSAGENDAGGSSNSQLLKRQVHGVLNAVSWGIMMPIGAMTVRYLRVFKSAGSAWFYLHVGCQTSAYFVGVAGWATGLKLGSESPSVTHSKHRNIGITLFCLGTLQVLALAFRPKPDHRNRFYWNVYHHVTGYIVIFLSIVNVYEGFYILNTQIWRKAYTSFIIIIAVAATFLEVITRRILLNTRSSTATHGATDANGA